MISRLPRWVWVGAWVLAFIAGVVNVVGLLGFEHSTITHLTGNTSQLAAALARLEVSATFHFLALLGSFVVGAIVSGLLIKDTALQLDHRYSVALSLESLLLFAAVPLLKGNSVSGLYLAACASGIQNAMVSTYSGALVRTTHVSGMFTDLGISLGHALRGLPVHMKRVWLSVLVISGFLVGGVFGTIAFQAFSYSALLFPAGLTALFAIGYGLYLVRSLAAAKSKGVSVETGGRAS